LAPGVYALKVAADGFLDEVRRVNVTGSRSEPIAIQLHLLGQRETVTVTETARQVAATNTGTKTPTLLIDIPQSISIVSRDLIKDQMMMRIGDVVRYVPGVTAIQGENNRDQVVIRGNSSSADFFLNGVRDDVQYYRDLYNAERVEALKGPNALIFGRGGGGGVINRVTKEAGFTPLREITLQGGSLNHKRFTTDFDHAVNEKAAFRWNGMYENSDSFRKFVSLERYGINPTLTVAPTQTTRVTLGYEYFHDKRSADRGIPSFQGRAADVPIATFFGDPNNSRVRAGVNLGSAMIEHQVGHLNVRNRMLAADYDRFYQNYVPGAVNGEKTQVALSSYNNATRRRNVFDQTDLTYTASTGALRHTLLWGAELGRQRSNNFRNTGYFGNTATSIMVPYMDPLPHGPRSEW
jgi:catecholate siderophore receptor